MPTADNAIVYYESGQSFTDFTAMTDSGDQTIFSSDADIWSGKSGKAATVRPNGLVTGGTVTAGSANNTVDVASLTCYLAGTLTTVSAAAGTTVTRGAGGGYIKSSITVTSAGAIAVVQGEEGSSFSDTRGAAGGPAWIPTDSIEVAQVWYSATDDAVVTSDEIKQVVGTHVERYDYPLWNENPMNVSAGSITAAGVTFYSALPAIHSDDDGSTTAVKKVYASYYEPSFTALNKTTDFVPPETSHSVSSTQIYGATIGSTSTTLNQASFTAYLNNGVDDPLVQNKNEKLWFKFKPDRLADKTIYCQGLLGITRSFGASDQIQASCTISSEVEGVEVYS